ncbi:CoA transferase [Cupriavidus basilensis]|uniref:CoA transferase n=1 Tax=Cupriavidus basilensis TaxID=68895 RepID=UPI0005B9E4C4|nr:CoA transferase [Cupriavidus basilensis]
MHDFPLDGVVVVERSDSASAPFAGQILAALGADVWKIERPTGDSALGLGAEQVEGQRRGLPCHQLRQALHQP